MQAQTRIRGARAAMANGRNNPNEVINQLNQAFGDFRDRNDARVSSLEDNLSEINRQISALRVGPGTSADGSHSGRNRQALQNLGRFGRSGDAEALRSGLTVNAAMSTDSSPDGGYLVPDELSDELLSIQRNGSALRRLARVQQVSSTSFKQPMNLHGAQSGWVGESSSRPETNGVDLAMLEIPTGEIYAMPAVMQNLLDDSAYDLGEFIATEIVDEFQAQEGPAFISGDGINKPRGFLTYDAVATADATRDFGDLQYVPSGVASAISDSTHNGVDALVDTAYALKSKYRQNASWLMNSTTASVLRKLKTIGDTENYLWQPSTQMGQPDRLLGYPVEIDEDMSDIGANAFPIAFGDWKRGYLITDRKSMRILRDPFTSKPNVLFYATKRVGGALIDSNAIKLLKCATS